MIKDIKPKLSKMRRDDDGQWIIDDMRPYRLMLDAGINVVGLG